MEAWRNLRKLSMRLQTVLLLSRNIKTSFNMRKYLPWLGKFRLRLWRHKIKLSFSTTDKCLQAKTQQTTPRSMKRPKNSNLSIISGPQSTIGRNLLDLGFTINLRSLTLKDLRKLLIQAIKQWLKLSDSSETKNSQE
jgi:hypothetical protein